MKAPMKLIPLLLIFVLYGYGQTVGIRNDHELNTSAPNPRVPHFDLTDSTLIEGFSKLSLEPIVGLHLGIEVILRENYSDPLDRSTRFSVSLEDTTVRDIIEKLCQLDNRYMWSTDGAWINVYPRETIGSPSYLLNRELEEITVRNINYPDEALAPLAKLLPDEQIGVAGIGIANSYSEPWSAVFKHLTVRQLMNRISEHWGSRSGWIWRGSKDQRLFFFFQFGFQPER